MPGPRRRMRRRAVVGGAVVGGAMLAGSHENKAAGEQAQADQQQVAAAPAAEPAALSIDEKTADIQKLDDLRESGALTEEEFAQQKQVVLDS